MLGQGGKALLLGAAAVVIAAGLKLAASLVLPLVLAALVAAVTAPLVSALRHRGVPAPLAITLGLLVDFAVLSLLGFLVVWSASAFVERLPDYQERLVQLFGRLSIWLSPRGVDLAEGLQALVGPGALMQYVATLLNNLLEVLSSLLLVFVLVGFTLFEAGGIDRKLARIIPDPHTFERIHAAAGEVNAFLAVKTLVSVATGFLIGILTAIVGLDLPVLWGLLAFLLNYIPTVGSIIAAIPPLLLALLEPGLTTFFLLGAGYAFVNLVIGNIVETRVMGETLGLSPAVTFASLIFWGWLLGPVGAVLSAPLTVVVKVCLAHTDDLAWVAVLLGPTDAPISRRHPGVELEHA